MGVHRYPSRRTSPVADYLYRGVNLYRPVPPVLTDQTIRGETYPVLVGTTNNRYKTVPPNTTVASLEDQVVWYLLETYEASATGGVTDSLMSSVRFGGGLRTRVILRAEGLPFMPVTYSYDWMDDHPGALSHILQSARGELRLRLFGLWALLDYVAMDPKKRRTLPLSEQLKVAAFGPDSLPATSPDSRFATENEWIAMTDEVDVSGAIDSTVQIVSERMNPEDDSRQYAVETLREVEEETEETRQHPHYVLVVTSRHNQTGGPYEVREIVVAYGRESGAASRPGEGADFIEPSDVPPHVRGVQ
jgi:hypothetical protein